MLYMFSQADTVPCTFLLNVKNELKDVAKGSTVKPLDFIFHTRRMPPGVFRVSVDQVLSYCE